LPFKCNLQRYTTEEDGIPEKPAGPRVISREFKRNLKSMMGRVGNFSQCYCWDATFHHVIIVRQNAFNGRLPVCSI
jgi:hypothetical protein